MIFNNPPLNSTIGFQLRYGAHCTLPFWATILLLHHNNRFPL